LKCLRKKGIKMVYLAIDNDKNINWTHPRNIPLGDANLVFQCDNE
jgi:hypothetical protein